MWVGYWLLVNADFWASMPADIQKIVGDAFDTQALTQRNDSLALNNSLQAKLSGEALVFNTPDPAPFRATLKSSGFYDQWQQKFGPALWSALEKYTGSLA
jgi:TRAP-type C4-dicarboxylate transport system substrate-binding protein